MRENQKPVHLPPKGSLWVPVECARCGVVKRDANGQVMYHDLLAGPTWAIAQRAPYRCHPERAPYRYRPERPASWVCEPCETTWRALAALADEDDPF